MTAWVDKKVAADAARREERSENRAAEKARRDRWLALAVDFYGNLRAAIDAELDAFNKTIPDFVPLYKITTHPESSLRTVCKYGNAATAIVLDTELERLICTHINDRGDGTPVVYRMVELPSGIALQVSTSLCITAGEEASTILEPLIDYALRVIDSFRR